MATTLNYNGIKKMFRSGETDLPKFEILNFISQSVNQNGINSEGQELLLRVLDRKDDFMEYKDIIISLIRKYGLYPYLKNFSFDPMVYCGSGTETHKVFMLIVYIMIL